MTVPRWRTIIAPGCALWPSESLIPRYFGFESLKFLAVPPAFLCAILFYLKFIGKISINNSMEKIKQFMGSEQGKDIFTVIIVILVGLGSFGLGRLSKNSQNPGIKIEYPNELQNQPANVISTQKIENTDSADKTFFASNRGTKYYS